MCVRCPWKRLINNNPSRPSGSFIGAHMRVGDSHAKNKATEQNHSEVDREAAVLLDHINADATHSHHGGSSRIWMGVDFAETHPEWLEGLMTSGLCTRPIKDRRGKVTKKKDGSVAKRQVCATVKLERIQPVVRVSSCA